MKYKISDENRWTTLSACVDNHVFYGYDVKQLYFFFDNLEVKFLPLQIKSKYKHTASKLSSNLKILHRASGLTFNELAENFDLTPDALAKYERGDREPKISNLVKIADYYGVSLDALVGRRWS